MNFKISTILKSHWSKILSVFIFIILLGAYANIFAIGSPYSPGSTLNPECAPGSINCYVDLNLSNPWFTGTSGVYTNNNTYIGSDTASVSASIGGGLFSNTYNPLTGIVGEGNEALPPGSFDMFSSVAINNDGNPVIAFYISMEGPITYNFIPTAEASGSNSTLYLIVCSDSNCNDGTMNEIDSNIETLPNFRPIVKIGTDNKPRIVYEASTYAGLALRYAVCSDEVCSSIEYSTNDYTSNYGLVNLGLSYFDDVISFSLDTNDVPYILYNMYSGVSLARYTGTGTENSCEWSDGEFINPDWECSQIPLPTSINDGYYLDYGIGDYIAISDEGNPRFIAEYNDDSGSTYITYNECSDSNCTNVTSTTIDLINEYNGWSTSSNLAINSDGIPYILYGFYDSNDNNRSDLKIAYLNTGNGSGCSESSDWNCVTIGSLDNNNSYYYWYSDMKIGEDNLPQIVVQKYLDSDDSYSIDYIKCSNTTCSNVTNSTIFSVDGNVSYSNYLGATLSISSNNSAYISYLDSQNELLLLTKISQSEGVSFNSSNNNSLYTGGDLGISGNLFVDGSIVTPNGLYINDGEPTNINNALYNIDGGLYWNGGLLSLGGTGSSSNSPIVVVSSSNLFSVGLDGFDNDPEMITNSIFLGSYAGYNRAVTDNNNFLGYQAGALNTYYGDGEGGNNFFGYQAGYDSTFVGNSNFFGYQAGYNGSSISNFFGYQAGYEANGSYGSNFIGFMAGYNAYDSNNSNFIGQEAGYNANDVYGSNFLGYQAGYREYANSEETMVFYSNFLGYQAGYDVYGARHSNFLGYQAGYGANWATQSNFLGESAGYNSDNAYYSNFLGYQAGYNASSAQDSNYLGSQAGYNASYAYYSNFLGTSTGKSATNARYSNFIGLEAGFQAANASNSIFIGVGAGYNDTVNNTANANDFSILIGRLTSTGGYKNSIAIGGSAVNTATNQLMIGSTNRPINTTVWKGTSVTATLDTATGLITTSDERLKTNIHILNTNEDYMDYASSTRESYTEDEISDMTTLEKVLKITPVRYDWREDPNNEYIFEQDINPKNIGFIAQDLINFFPEVVYAGHDENKYLGVNYANMTPILVEAIKELNLKVEAISLDDNDLNIFSSIIKKVQNGIAYLTGLVVDTIEIGSSDKPAGIILYSKSGDKYCLFVDEGGNSVTEAMQEGDECPKIEAPSDVDEDGVIDEIDNCPSIPNSLQEDEDSNGVGDVCEVQDIDQSNPPADPQDPEAGTV